jgi:hypothetical protein
MTVPAPFAYVFVVLTVIFSVSSCDSGGVVPISLVCTQDAQPAVLMPLEVGNFWEFDVVRNNGVSEDPVRIEILEKTDFVLDSETGPIFASDIYNIGKETPQTLDLWQNQEGGTALVGRINDFDTLIVNGHLKPFPAPGPTSTYFRSFRLDPETGIYQLVDSTAFPLISINEVVETPAGTFSTYVFKWFIPPTGDITLGKEILYHWAPGVGEVARFWRNEGGTTNSKSWLLRDYCLMAPANT